MPASKNGFHPIAIVPIHHKQLLQPLSPDLHALVSGVPCVQAVPCEAAWSHEEREKFAWWH